jgi:hypothetical protein
MAALLCLPGCGSVMELGDSGSAGRREVPGASGKPRAEPIASPGQLHFVDYFGGRVVGRMEVIQVLYGAGSYLPEVTSAGTPSLASFYRGVLDSEYVDWLAEYDTPAQSIRRGRFVQQVTIAPSARNRGALIDDRDIQAELSAQIAAGHLPAPHADTAGNNNTYYAVFFPHGQTITVNGAASCASFCAYHSAIADAGGTGEIYYGVHPDMQPGSGCEAVCGAEPTAFDRYTVIASHEMIETITDPEIGLTPGFPPAFPMAWNDSDTSEGEIADLCNQQFTTILGRDGVPYRVQTAYSRRAGRCVATRPGATDRR